MNENPIIGKAYNIVEEVVTMLAREIIAQAREIEELTTEREGFGVRIRELELLVSVLTSQAQECEHDGDH